MQTGSRNALFPGPGFLLLTALVLSGSAGIFLYWSEVNARLGCKGLGPGILCFLAQIALGVAATANMARATRFTGVWRWLGLACNSIILLPWSYWLLHMVVC